MLVHGDIVSSKTWPAKTGIWWHSISHWPEIKTDNISSNLVHASMLLNMTLWPVAVALEALVDVANDLQLVVHGEVQLPGHFLLPPNLGRSWPCVKLVLLCAKLEDLDPIEVKIDPVQPILLVHLLDSLVHLLDGLQSVHKVGPGDPLMQVRCIHGNFGEEEGGEENIARGVVVVLCTVLFRSSISFTMACCLIWIDKAECSISWH